MVLPFSGGRPVCRDKTNPLCEVWRADALEKGPGMERPDAGLRQLTVYRLRRAAVQMLSSISQELAPLGLRRTTFSALSVVVGQPGLRQTQLADALAIERPNLVKIVDELEAAGLIQRRQADGDRRAYALHPTKAGKALHQRAFEAVQAADRRLMQGLSLAEIEALNAALHLIEGNAGGAVDATLQGD
ncbi:MarR family winged helix-turn-helix transcriptional regulator [uncultured Mameliella sp.]|uniref:MarR family winged helix-turn-helix transcriptional regulator n=2 Tax=Mameliella TaxID=1434019 RepID=UPI0026082173|nr:MarR family transcriptional regulator [uncultured Mameliella sp.]